MSDLVWTTKKVKVKDLKQLDINPRTISGENKDKLIRSIDKFNLVEIPAVNTDMTIIGGNQRVSALILADRGDEEIDVRVPNRSLTEDEIKEYALISNTHAGEFDWDIMSEHFSDVDIEFDIPNMPEPEIVAPEGKDEVREVPKIPKTVLGDLYEIGDHRLLCGDSTCSDTVTRLLGGDGNKVDMVFTDPPYNVDYGNIKHSKVKARSIKNDNMNSSDFKTFCESFVSNIVLFCDGVVYCWAGPGKDGRIMFTVLDEFLYNSTVVVWNKDVFTLGRGKYQNKAELCWFGWNKSGKSFTDDRTLSNVWDVARPKQSKEHPTMKPIPLIEMAIKHNPVCLSVLDLFLGSGSTMVACHNLNRKCYGLELDPGYCDVIVSRMLLLDPSIIIKRNGKLIDKSDYILDSD